MPTPICKTVYHCRNCGRRFFDGTVEHKNRMKIMSDTIIKQEGWGETNKDTYLLFTHHQCTDNLIGLADFLGIEIENI